MKILHCDCCSTEVNNYSHWYNGAQPRNMYELKCVRGGTFSGTYDGMIICHKCIERLFHTIEESEKEDEND